MSVFMKASMPGMVDTHMHIIPGVDDGSNTMEMSKDMLGIAYEQGIRHIIATPHSSAFRYNSDKVFSEFARLQRYAKTVYPDMMLKIGSEVLFTEDNKDLVMEEILSGKLPSMNGSPYILTEFLEDVDKEFVLEVIDVLQKNSRKTLIAHAERYRKCFADDAMIDLVKRKGAKLQINAYSLNEETDQTIRSTARRMLEREAVDVLGSDAHRTDHRSPRVQCGLEYIFHNTHKEYGNRVASINAKRMFHLNEQIIYDGMYGLAVADALGVPYESETLENMQRHPCVDMIGFHHHNQPKGSWSDDTSMSLCVADSLSRGYDLTDMMKRFSSWYNNMEYTAAGKTFDVGRLCRRAIGNFREGLPAEYCGDRTINGNGNGALMRTFPIAFYQCLTFHDDSLSDFLAPIHGVSSLTHAHEIGLICCGLFSLMLKELLTDSNSSLLDAAQSAYSKAISTYSSMEGDFKKYLELFSEPSEIMKKTADMLPSWGYALNTWNIALWSLLTTESYHDCVLKAINVGGDTDTNAAVAGALAGVYYGKESIPAEWIDALLNKQLIDAICSRFNRMVLGVENDVSVIDQFKGKYAFLRMKTPVQIRMNGRCYQNLAAAFYAQSTPESLRDQFEYLDAKRAWKLYKKLPHNELTENQLYEAVKALYEQNPKEREKLLDTAPLEIIYDTTSSHDNVFGRCRCKDCLGKEYQNLYGKILMQVRDELQYSEF